MIDLRLNAIIDAERANGRSLADLTRMVVAGGATLIQSAGANGSPYAPLDDGRRIGLVKYQIDDGEYFIRRRSEDAYKKMVALNPNQFGKDNHPTEAYTSAEKCREYFADDEDRFGYRKMAPVAREAVRNARHMIRRARQSRPTIGHVFI